MSKPKSDCGAACAELNTRQHRFHLLVAAMGLPDGLTSLEACYIDAGYAKSPSPTATSASATRLHGSASIQEALAHHKAAGERRYWKTKDRQVDRLSARAEGASARHFLEIDDEGVVKIKGWGDIDPELIRGVGSVEIDSETGKVKKITVRDDVQAEKALAELLGHNKPQTLKIEAEGIDEAAARLAEAIARRAKVKDPDAA